MPSSKSGDEPKPAKKSASRSQRNKAQAKKSATSQSQPPDLPSDRRAMEKSLSDISKLLSSREFASVDEMNSFLQSVVTSQQIPSLPGTSALEQAQELIYDAWEASGKRRVTLARQALKISPDCTDAYVLLAEETAKSIEEAKDLYEQGMKAGERTLGPETFEEEVGHFWGLVETRPYMRARAGLAGCLWHHGQRDQAIEHYQEMLCLNPNDNQGIRYLLADCLLAEGRDEELGKLLEQYDEATAWWLYTKALWLYRREGASPKANVALKEAFRQNRYVPSFLQGITSLPQQAPCYVGFGDEDEAVSYVLAALEKWHATPGALDWLSTKSGEVQSKASSQTVRGINRIH